MTNNKQLWNEIINDVQKINFKADQGLIKTSVIVGDFEKFETYIFANFDICNFTKYKREHSDWVELLKNFLFTVSNPAPDWSVPHFWKFNGDSLTFRKKVKSVYEICFFIKQAQGHLTELQKFLNKTNKSNKYIYVKAAVWIAGFVDPKSPNERLVNNTRFYKSPFGEEFVGENMDEGFRLSMCSKAGKLIIDPKIVLITNLYSLLNYFVENNKNIGNLKKDEQGKIDEKGAIEFINEQFKKDNIRYDLSNKKILDILLIILHNLLSMEDYKDFKQLVSKTSDCFYLMEYATCKGVWDDRDYPIFWYIEDINNCDLVYDEIVDGKKLREHKLYDLIQKDNKDYKTYFKNARIDLLNICGQIEVLSTIEQLVKNLSTMPLGYSEETIYDTANLYYMVACVVVKDGIDKGVLIFKRAKARKHLKYVWDLVPVKHSRIYKPNINFSIRDYLLNMIGTRLNLSENIRNNIVIRKDEIRDSIKPYAICNIYRNGEVHNGILCVAEMNINSKVASFVSEIRNCIKEKNQYDDVQLISLDNINNNDNEYDIIIKGKKNYTIKSLSPEQVRFDSNEVAIDENYATFTPRSDDACEYGISYLGYSIKQILEERKIEQERNK